MNPDALEQIAADWLRKRGYSVEYMAQWAEWLTPTEAGGRYGLNATATHSRLHHPDCPWYATEKGESGRIIRIRLNPDLDRWLSILRQPGKRLKAAL